MLEEVGQTLRPVRRFARQAGGDGSSDQEELALHRGGHPPRPSLHHGVEPPDGVVEPPEHGRTGMPAIPVLLERDDLGVSDHDLMMTLASDTVGSRLRPPARSSREPGAPGR